MGLRRRTVPTGRITSYNVCYTKLLRIGVFVCHCGTNIAGIVDVPGVAEYAATLPYVEFAINNLYSCSQDTQETITQIIKQKNLNLV